jgi:hypothetical protein
VLYAFTFDGKGKPIASKQIASRSASEAGAQTDTVTLAAGGVIDVSTTATVPLHDAPTLTELVTTASHKVRIGLDGSIALEPGMRSADGRFDDPASKEVLIVSFAKKKVLYRGTPEKPVQDLVVTALDAKAGTGTVAFSGSKDKLYQLAWAADRTAIVCTAPDGKAQTFQRVW